MVATRSNPRRDGSSEFRDAVHALRRHGVEHVRVIRRRSRPDVVIPRGFLPLVVH